MVQIRNIGRFPALVQGYWLYPGETRSVPAKVVQRLLDTNPDLALCNSTQPSQQPHALAELETVPESEPEPEPAAQPESVADPSTRARRRK